MVCAALGAADQYVGSLTRYWAHSWEVPALSAPWLLLPFVVGRLQPDRFRAAALGLLGTLAALVGYGLMTISPVEHAQLTLGGFAAFARSNLVWLAGGVLTGPLFGWLGHRWRVARDPSAAVVMAGAVTLEPLVHAVAYRRIPLGSIPFGPVTAAEAAVGVALALWFVRQRLRALGYGSERVKTTMSRPGPL